MSPATREELIKMLQAVETDLNADVLFDPNPQWEGEQQRYDAAVNTLAQITNILSREDV